MRADRPSASRRASAVGAGPKSWLRLSVGRHPKDLIRIVMAGAVLTMRLLAYWLPVVPGSAMFRVLQHHNIV